MYIAILGRQPELSVAELAACFGQTTRTSRSVAQFTSTTPPDIQRLGGSLKLAQQRHTVASSRWDAIETALLDYCSETWGNVDHKLTIGLSAYDLNVTPKQLHRTALKLKQRLKSAGVSVRLLPVTSLELSTATAHHNKLGLSDNKIELLITPHDNGAQIATSLGAQNITALARRDQGRPKRDAFVGMLPPKLALMMVNLAGGIHAPASTVLDPFCGTGVVLQEAALLGYSVYGSDLSDKMIDYSRVNLEWLAASHHVDPPAVTIEHGDAMKHHWQAPIDAVACEAYLGQPFSAPPSPAKLREVRGNCNHIISEFLKNIGEQIKPGTPLCVAVPAWRDRNGRFTHLPLTKHLTELGYERIDLPARGVAADMPLLYYREDQVVARELLVMKKAA